MESLYDINTFVAAFFSFRVGLILVLFIIGIPLIVILGYIWWTRRL